MVEPGTTLKEIVAAGPTQEIVAVIAEQHVVVKVAGQMVGRGTAVDVPIFLIVSVSWGRRRSDGAFRTGVQHHVTPVVLSR